ncbi:MAG: DNA (cytosine-5-)-methyltransferase [Flavobacteriia bacterium]|nr:DNA (cytosine-5-)-methyltransferase [Flavobacteriia bacterium]
MTSTSRVSANVSHLRDTAKTAKTFLMSVEQALKDTAFFDESLAITTQFIHAGIRHPDVPSSIYDDYEELHVDKPKKPDFSFIDLFAGIGGFRMALENIGGAAVFSSEWEKNAKQTYFSNHSEYPFGDINKFTNEDVSDNRLGALLPSHDLLAAGFPCQPFSLAGVSARNSRGIPHGLECKTQGTLFRSIERIAQIKQPKVLLLENVKNIRSHDGGKTFKIIKESIESAGYVFFSEVVNSDTVVPQRRQRCFMVCVRKDIHQKFGDFVFPSFEGQPLPLSKILSDSVDERYTISEALWLGHIARSERNKSRGTGFTTSLADVSKPSNTIVARYGKDGKECLIPQPGKMPRTLSIEECKKLFGLEPSFKLPSAKTVAFKLLGNSVVVPVVQRIAEQVKGQYLVG